MTVFRLYLLLIFSLSQCFASHIDDDHLNLREFLEETATKPLPSLKELCVNVVKETWYRDLDKKELTKDELKFLHLPIELKTLVLMPNDINRIVRHPHKTRFIVQACSALDTLDVFPETYWTTTNKLNETEFDKFRITPLKRLTVKAQSNKDLDCFRGFNAQCVNLEAPLLSFLALYKIKPFLQSFVGLTSLNLDHAKCGYALQSVIDLPKLRFLSMNYVNSRPEYQVRALQGLTQLEELFANGTCVRIKDVVHMPKLRVLSLNNNSNVFLMNKPDAISGLRSLRLLQVKNNQASLACVLNLMQLKNLEEVRVGADILNLLNPEIINLFRIKGIIFTHDMSFF